MIYLPVGKDGWEAVRRLRLRRMGEEEEEEVTWVCAAPREPTWAKEGAL